MIATRLGDNRWVACFETAADVIKDYNAEPAQSRVEFTPRAGKATTRLRLRGNSSRIAIASAPTA
jgi:hypothetical protein